jgi:hypothetical protein
LYNIVCPWWFWPWYCLTFFEVFCITLFVLVGFGHGIVWPSSMQYHGQNQQGKTMLCKTHWRTSDNTIAKTNKYKQCYTKHIKERQTIQWPKPTRTNNVIQNTWCVLYNIVCPCWFWPWYCLTFFDVFCITLFVFLGFGHVMVWRSSMCFV